MQTKKQRLDIILSVCLLISTLIAPSPHSGILHTHPFSVETADLTAGLFDLQKFSSQFTAVTNGALHLARSSVLEISPSIRITAGVDITGPVTHFFDSSTGRGWFQNEKGKKLEVEWKRQNDKNYLKVGNSVYFLPDARNQLIDLSRLNPIGNQAWFRFFDRAPQNLPAEQCLFPLPIAVKTGAVRFPVNPVWHAGLMPPRLAHEEFEKIKEAFLDALRQGVSPQPMTFGELADFLHLTIAFVQQWDNPEHFLLAQDFLNALSENETRPAYKRWITSAYTFLRFSATGVSWKRWSEVVPQKLKARNYGADAAAMSPLTIYNQDVRLWMPSDILAATNPEDWTIERVEPFRGDVPLLQPNDEIPPQPKVGVLILGAGASQRVQKALKLLKNTLRAIRTITNKGQQRWLSTTEALVGVLLGQKGEVGNICLVTGINGTRAGGTTRELRRQMMALDPEGIRSGRIGFSLQRDGLVVDAQTGVERYFQKSGAPVTHPENHLLAFLSFLANKKAVLRNLKEDNGIFFIANADNIRSHLRRHMIRQIIDSRREVAQEKSGKRTKQPLLTSAIVHETSWDTKGGFLADITLFNPKANRRISIQRFIEMSEMPTRPGSRFKNSVVIHQTDKDFYTFLDTDGLFIEDLFKARPAKGNSATYAVDLRLMVARLFGFNETSNDTELLAQLESVSDEEWPDTVDGLAEQLWATFSTGEVVDDETGESQSGLWMDQTVQELFVNSPHKITKRTGLPPLRVDFLQGTKPGEFPVFKGYNLPVMDANGEPLPNLSDEVMDIVALQPILAKRYQDLSRGASKLQIQLGDGEWVKEIQPVTLEEIIAYNRNHQPNGGSKNGVSTVARRFGIAA